MKYKLLVSLFIGIGIVGLVFTTLDLTWIVGISLLMPGIAFLGTLPYSPMLDSTPLPMLIVNALIYSVVALAGVQIASRSLGVIAWQKVAKTTCFLASVTVLAGWFSTRLLVSKGFGSCRNEATEYVYSPGARYRAVIFHRNCGATSDFVTNVSILKGLEVINHSTVGNVFIASGQVPIQLNWTSATHLVVTYPTAVKPSFTDSAFDNVTVEFVTKARRFDQN